MEMFKQPFRSGQEPEPDQTAPKRVIKADLDDLVYEGKNKAYGGHPLRKEEGIRTFNAMVVVAGIIALSAVLINWNSIMAWLFPEAHPTVALAEITASPEELALSRDQLIPVNFNMTRTELIPSSAAETAENRVEMTLEVAIERVGEGPMDPAVQTQVNQWLLEQNLNRNPELLENFHFRPDVVKEGGFGTTSLLVKMDAGGKLSAPRHTDSKVSEFDQALAAQVRGLSMSPLLIDGEAHSATLIMSFHHRLLE